MSSHLWQLKTRSVIFMKSYTGEFTDIFLTPVFLNSKWQCNTLHEEVLLISSHTNIYQCKKCEHKLWTKTFYALYPIYFFLSLRLFFWDNYTNLCRYTGSFWTYFQACNPYYPHATRCTSYFMNNFSSERSSSEQTVCNDLKSAVQDPSRALKSQRGEEMSHVLWNLDVQKSVTIFCPEADKSIHILTLFFFKY